MTIRQNALVMNLAKHFHRTIKIFIFITFIYLLIPFLIIGCGPQDYYGIYMKNETKDTLLFGPCYIKSYLLPNQSRAVAGKYLGYFGIKKTKCANIVFGKISDTECNDLNYNLKDENLIEEYPTYRTLRCTYIIKPKD